MAFKQKPDEKLFEDVCCGAYCEEAGCCPHNYFPKLDEERDPDTKDMFPDEYNRPDRRNPDVGNNDD